jgi:hypothetical protein
MLQRIAIVSAVTLGLLGATVARGHGDYGPARLEGAWIADVTLVSCTTGEPTPAPPFQAVVVFHAGGTLSEASGPSVRRTPSYGTWNRSGRAVYQAVSVLLTYDVNGLPSGSQEIRRVIQVARDGQSFTADTRTIARDPNGVVLFRGCARGQARRVQ